MAAQNQRSATWPSVVNLLLDTFLLLRDIFGYALPGGLFLAVGIISGRLSLSRLDALLAPYHPPTWALAILLITGCYLVGHVLAGIAYLRNDFWKLFHLNDTEWMADYPTEVNGRDLYLRHYYPGLFREWDRRETLAMLTYCTVAALLLGWIVFFLFHPSFGDVLIWTAVLVFLDAVTAMSHLTRVRKAIHTAGVAIEEREKATQENQHAIQPKGDELRFVIDAIIRAAELASPKQPAAETQTQAQTTHPNSSTPVSAAPSTSSRNAPDI
jgi:hypothetical protein